jgi:hypothetical protein
VVPVDLAPGTYYLGAIADADGLVPEINNNNTWNTVQITVAEPPNLVASLGIGRRQWWRATT